MLWNTLAAAAGPDPELRRPPLCQAMNHVKIFMGREIENFIIRQPPTGEKDDYDSENSWISNGLPSSSRRRRRGDGRWEVGEWREK